MSPPLVAHSDFRILGWGLDRFHLHKFYPNFGTHVAGRSLEANKRPLYAGSSSSRPVTDDRFRHHTGRSLELSLPADHAPIRTVPDPGPNRRLGGAAQPSVLIICCRASRLKSPPPGLGEGAERGAGRAPASSDSRRRCRRIQPADGTRRGGHARPAPRPSPRAD